MRNELDYAVLVRRVVTNMRSSVISPKMDGDQLNTSWNGKSRLK